MGTIFDILLFILVGLISGWLAGKLTRGRGFGVKVNLILGIIGSFLGGFLFWILGFSTHSIIASIIVSTLGALLAIYLFNHFRHKI